MLIVSYIVTATTALLTLALFDSNPWWAVVLYAAGATALNYWIFQTIVQTSSGFSALGQGVLGAFLAYICGLTSFFRTTFGTLVGYALLLAFGHFVLNRLNHTRT